MFSIGYFNKSS